MTEKQFEALKQFRTEFKNKCDEWNKAFSKELFPLQKESAKKDTPDYPLETAVVYNTALDELTIDSEIRLIVIGDNPGKNEQLAKNKKYLVGQAGKIGEGFFKKNPELGVDFRKNVIILNKTPVHSAKTIHLKQISRNGSEKIKMLLLESQNWMAEKTSWLLKELINNSENKPSSKTELLYPAIWLVGYAELKNNGIFIPYRDALKKQCTGNAWNNVFVFQHFSMNRFTIDLKNEMDESLSLAENIQKLGTEHKNEIFGF